MDDNFKLFEAAQMAKANNTPNSRWAKVQLSKVAAKVLDPLTSKPVDIVIEGEPGSESSIINCWTPLETAYFEQANQYHILNGNIVPFNKPIVTPKSPNTLSDEQITKILAKKFLAVANLLKKLDSVTTVERVLKLAEGMNKPSATITAIKAKLAELQQKEYNEIK